MNQPTPAVTSEDVEPIVRRDFPDDDFDKALAVLSGYETSNQQSEPYRVQLAALKLANGDLGALRYHIISANNDYRDIIAAAEYPVYMLQGSSITNLTECEKKLIIDSDWRQYKEWLQHAGSHG